MENLQGEYFIVKITINLVKALVVVIVMTSLLIIIMPGIPSLGANIARGIFLSVESTLQINSIERNIALLEKILKIATIKYNNGSLTLQDVALIRSDLPPNRENLIKSKGARRDLLRALEVLIGSLEGESTGLSSILNSSPVPTRPEN